MAGKVVCRIVKHNRASMGTLHAAADHCDRMRETPNAAPDITGSNPSVGAPRGGIVQAVEERIAQIGCKVRANAVVCVEYVLSASPEFFRPEDPAAAGSFDQGTMQRWAARTLRWLQAKHGAQNVVAVRVHLDEATPHISAFVVPEMNGALNAKAMFGGREKMQSLQDEAAAAVADLGLERGVRGSRAKHTPVKAFYAAVAASEAPKRVILPPASEIAVKVPPRLFLGQSPEDWAAEETARLSHELASYRNRAERDVHQQTHHLQQRAETAHLATSRRKGAETTIRRTTAEVERLKAERRAEQDAARALPLPAVLQRLGFTQDTKGSGVKAADPNRWRSGECTLSLGKDPNLFTIWSGGHSLPNGKTGGRGAIDLVMATRGDDFHAAVAWLSAQFGVAEVARTVRAEAETVVRTARDKAIEDKKAQGRSVNELAMPKREDRHWQHVRAYLTETRRLDPKVIDWLHERGQVYADNKRNAVFLMGDPENPHGAELRGTSGAKWNGIAPGSNKAENGFRIVRGVDLEARGVPDLVLTEAAIDALSYAQRFGDRHTRGLVVQSTAGAAIEHKAIEKALEAGARVFVAYDDDPTGDKRFQALRGRYGAALIRLKTGQGETAKDWNAVLCQNLPDDRIEAATMLRVADGQITPEEQQRRQTDALNVARYATSVQGQIGALFDVKPKEPVQPREPEPEQPAPRPK